MSSAFAHTDAGTPESAWADLGLESLPPVVASDRRLIVLAAHPDDESLGSAGLIAASARLGARVTVIVATDGEASHPDSPTHPPNVLAVLRRDEVRAAVARLAPAAEVRLLGLPDGELSHQAAALDAALADVAAGDPAGRPRVVTPWTGDGHPDHTACAEAGARFCAEREAEHWQYPIWLWHWGNPTELPRARMRRLELTTTDLAAKLAALDEHVSQHRALSDAPGDEPVLPPHMLEHFRRPYECFVLTAPASQPAYFDELYAHAADPWGLGDRFYERRKRAVLIAALPRERFRRVFEPGCATGELSAALAERADEIVAWDVAAAAVRMASERFGHLPGARVSVQRGRIPADWPDGAFDLIVLSEVGYYCDDLDTLVRRVLGSLSPDGALVACHWVRPAPDHPHPGVDVHDAFDRVLRRIVRHDEDDFRLDVWSRTGESVAVAEGIV